MITLSLCSLPLCLLLLPPHTFHFLPPSSLPPPSIHPSTPRLRIQSGWHHHIAFPRRRAKPQQSTHRRARKNPPRRPATAGESEREGGPEISMYERSPLIASFDVNSLQTGSINLSLFFRCCSATERRRQRKVEMMFLQSHRGALNIS